MGIRDECVESSFDGCTNQLAIMAHLALNVQFATSHEGANLIASCAVSAAERLERTPSALPPGGVSSPEAGSSGSSWRSLVSCWAGSTPRQLGHTRKPTR